MTKIYLILLLGIGSCNGQSLLEKHDSPSGQYSLEVELGDRDNAKNKYGLMFKLVDKDNKELNYIKTGSSDVMKWAVTWYNDTTIILDSHDIGTYGWTISQAGKLIPMENVSQTMEDKAVEAFMKKYGAHDIQH